MGLNYERVMAYRPADIIAFFAPDRVNDDYSYSVASTASFSREDAAMLVEETLMQRRYGVFRDVAVSDVLPAGGTSSDLIVRWGQRGRVGDDNPSSRSRACRAASRLLARDRSRISAPRSSQCGARGNWCTHGARSGRSQIRSSGRSCNRPKCHPNAAGDNSCTLGAPRALRATPWHGTWHRPCGSPWAGAGVPRGSFGTPSGPRAVRPRTTPADDSAGKRRAA